MTSFGIDDDAVASSTVSRSLRIVVTERIVPGTSEKLLPSRFDTSKSTLYGIDRK